MARKLLSITIPTYNRAKYLDLCLAQIKKNLVGFEDEIEVLVSDNASTDDTAAIIERHRAAGLVLTYSRNPTNIGMDRNFHACFTKASGKYVWIFSDDSVMLDGAVETLLRILREDDYGVVFLNHYDYDQDYLQPVGNRLMAMPKDSSKYVVFKVNREFVAEVNYWFSYISGNIVNKEKIPADFDTAQFFDTYLACASWYLAAALNAERNVIIYKCLLAEKTANTGGYGIANVFGEGFSKVFAGLTKMGYPDRCFDPIKRELIINFFPPTVFSIRRGIRLDNDRVCAEDYQENYNRVLKPLFSRYPAYWIYLFPVLRLPLALAVPSLLLMIARRAKWRFVNAVKFSLALDSARYHVKPI